MKKGKESLITKRKMLRGKETTEEKLWNEIKASIERDFVNKAARWLKSKGVNPHVNVAGVRSMGQTGGRETEYLAVFNRVTGDVIIPDIHTILTSNDSKGILEHELFHRADYLEKLGGNRKGRKKIYAKWKATKKMMETISEHIKTGKRGTGGQEEHPLYKAINILESKGCSATDSLLKLWMKDRKKFTKMLKLATAAWSVDPKLSKISKDKRDRIEMVKRVALMYFTHTPVKERAVEKYYKFLSEIPAYMVMFHLQGMRPEEGIVAAKILLTKKEYFGGKGMEDVIRDTADKYARLALTLRKAGLSDNEILESMLALHKNVHTPKDIQMLLKNKEMVVKAAHAVRAWAGSKDIREGIAAQSLGRMEKIASKAIKVMEREKARRLGLRH